MPIPDGDSASIDDLPFNSLPTIPEMNAIHLGYKPLTTAFTEAEFGMLKHAIKDLCPVPYVLVRDSVGISVWRIKSGFRD